jgi:hypothetical protein
MGTKGDIIQPKLSHKSALKYYCESCDYFTSKKSNYDTHIISVKHLKVTNGSDKGHDSARIQPLKYCSEEIYECICGKKYIHRQGLWRHKTKGICSKPENKLNDNINSSSLNKDDLIIQLLKQNADLMEILKNGTNNTNNTINNTNSHNKEFNLNFFLNETCKNAMNITEFVDSIKLQLTDLVNVGEKGYIEGISDIIVKNLKNMDETERPVHCADKKREICYIKDEGKWEKDEDKKKMKQIVKKVAYKNERLLPLFKEEYPDYNDSDSIRSDQYSKIVIEAMGGIDGNSIDKEYKIIKNISKASVINKCI